MTDLERHADALLAAIGHAAPGIGDGVLTLHWPTVGAAFDHGVLVIGQAVFGWMNGFTAEEARDSAARARTITAAKDPFDGLEDPMGWIDGHRVRTSPFWSVARQVTDALAPGASPSGSAGSHGQTSTRSRQTTAKGNPAGALLGAQTQPAAAFVDAVVNELQPSLVLVAGGPYVWPFSIRLVLGSSSLPIARSISLGDRSDPWIVGMHPGGASRRGWGPTPTPS